MITKRMVFGGAAFNEERSAETAVVCVGAGTFSASDSLSPQPRRRYPQSHRPV